jgi:hypothetical protein
LIAPQGPQSAVRSPGQRTGGERWNREIGRQPGVQTGGLLAHMGTGLGRLSPQKSDLRRLLPVTCHPCTPTPPGAGRTRQDRQPGGS